jgi:sigma-B regulation protein RsbU (phosphoserine phosphatase)
MVLRGRPDGSSYRAAEIKSLGTIACLASAFIRVEREGRAGRDAAGAWHAVEVAAEVHRRLHPEDAPAVPGFDVAAGCRPAEGVAGAAFGFLPLRGGDPCLYAADLSRRGMAGALDLMTTRGALLTAASRATSAAEVLRGAGAVLAGEYARQEVCATAVVVRLAPGGRQIGWASAGHSPQLLVRADRSVELLEASGPALGALGALDYAERVVSLAPGDFVLLATDAVIDARNGRGRAFGAERLSEAATGCVPASARVIRNAVLAEVYRHCGDSVPQDDLMLLVIRATDASLPEDRR